MITIPGEVASAANLAQGDRALVYELVRSWERHRAGNELRHAYYLMHNRLVDLGISVPPELRRLNAACGWGKKCVDVMVEHSKLDGLTAGDADARALLGSISRRNHLRSLYRKATTSALEQCFALYLVTRDSETGHARVSAYPARVCGVKWDDARGELAAAMFVVATKTDRGGRVTPTWVDVVTDANVIRIRKGDRGWAADYEPHGLGHLPAFIAPFEATLERPFGTSRITREVMGYIDSAVRANVNEEIASAFAASTQKYLMGTDGDPFEHVTRWDTYIGSIVNVDMTADGTVPQFGQLPQPSMQPLSDHWRLLCGRMSAATGIHVSQFGQVHDNPASSDAIYAENEPLILKVKDWNEDAGECLSDVAVACLATEWGKTFDEVMDMGLDVGASFANPAMPTLAQQTDASVKMASVLDGFAETDTFLALNGFGEEERKRIRRELDDVRRAANRDAMIASVFGGATDEGASGDETSA